MSSRKILIIGAGACGVAAATHLLESGHSNLVILEAENRIGGRIHTVPFGANVVDLGAQWCHGEKDNVVYELVTRLQKDLLEGDSGKHEHYLLIRSNGQAVNQEVTDKLMKLVYSIEDDNEAEVKDFQGSLGAFVTQK